MATLIALLDDLGIEGAELLEAAAGPKHAEQLECNAHEGVIGCVSMSIVLPPFPKGPPITAPAAA